MFQGKMIIAVHYGKVTNLSTRCRGPRILGEQFVALTRATPLVCCCAQVWCVTCHSLPAMASVESILALLNCHPLGSESLLGILLAQASCPGGAFLAVLIGTHAAFVFDLS